MSKKLQNIKLPDLNEAYQKVMQYFFSFPNMECGLNELSQALGISKTTAKRIVETLEKEGILLKKVYGKTWRITCNQSHSQYISNKIVFNLSMIYSAFNSSLKEEIHKVVGNPHSIVLFGSYRKGDDIEKSDIDIAVEVADNKEIRIIELGVIPKFGHRRDVSVNIHIFSRNKIDINLFSNIVNGIVLEGFLESKP
jgi:predicted nucleotidyltransferase/biotin operon repressor